MILSTSCVCVRNAVSCIVITILDPFGFHSSALLLLQLFWNGKYSNQNQKSKKRFCIHFQFLYLMIISWLLILLMGNRSNSKKMRSITLVQTNLLTANANANANTSDKFWNSPFETNRNIYKLLFVSDVVN